MSLHANLQPVHKNFSQKHLNSLNEKEIGKNNLVRKRTRVYEWTWTHRYYTQLGIGRFQISKGAWLILYFFSSLK
jgi:hypothetical protein